MEGTDIGDGKLLRRDILRVELMGVETVVYD